MRTKPARAELLRMIELTRDEERDCAEFVELLAEYVDGSIQDERVLRLLDHHRHLCPECEEELDTLRRALSSHEPG